MEWHLLWCCDKSFTRLGKETFRNLEAFAEQKENTKRFHRAKSWQTTIPLMKELIKQSENKKTPQELCVIMVVSRRQAQPLLKEIIDQGVLCRFLGIIIGPDVQKFQKFRKTREIAAKLYCDVFPCGNDDEVIQRLEMLYALTILLQQYRNALVAQFNILQSWDPKAHAEQQYRNALVAQFNILQNWDPKAHAEYLEKNMPERYDE